MANQASSRSAVSALRAIDPVPDAERYAGLPALGWTRAYRTGAVVRETIDGLAFIGRRDDRSRSGGRRLELGELDAQLSAAPGVGAASAAVKKTAAGNSVPLGHVDTAKGSEPRSPSGSRQGLFRSLLRSSRFR